MKLTIFEVIEKAKAKGYAPSMSLDLLMTNSVKDTLSRELVGEGKQLLPHLELDRLVIFKLLFPNDWEDHLKFAHDMYMEGKIQSSIDFLQEVMGEQE